MISSSFPIVQKLFQYKHEINLCLFKLYHHCILFKKRKQHQQMVKTDLKRKICTKLEETHIATWHQHSFNKVKLFLESYDKTWLSQFDCTQKKLKYKNTQEKACLCCRCIKEFYQGNHHRSKTKQPSWMHKPLNQKFQIQ